MHSKPKRRFILRPDLTSTTHMLVINDLGLHNTQLGAEQDHANVGLVVVI